MKNSEPTFYIKICGDWRKNSRYRKTTKTTKTTKKSITDNPKGLNNHIKLSITLRVSDSLNGKVIRNAL